MLALLAKYWWLVALRGVLAIVFGVLAFVWPGITIGVLVIFFGAWALVNGVFAVVAALGGRGEHDHWVLLLLEGLAGVLIGVVTYIAPEATAAGLLIYIAAWALATGVLQVAAAIRLRKEIEGEAWLALSGLASIGFAVILLIRPLAGALALLWVIAAYAIAFGVFLLFLAFRVRGVAPR